ncbi:hypothetical protein [Nostoc sp. TCL26-01]|uniref:hypothetical protein n=1 Tax=Nostoc sp. TCL26-01 TaxID=2576904 RepID=UPI0015B90CD7|nr:hypothetical protein [Nostoc sp. TCL26-01]QLE57387.1 hypothetical protein FD725_18795 [Nostoc sp. TCL26-01]
MYIRIIVLILCFLLSLTSTKLLAKTPPQTTRNPWLQPFTPNSIWNMPIGANAKYVPAGIKKAAWIAPDIEYLFKLKATDPKRPLYTPGSWTKRCQGKNTAYISLPIPDDLIIPDATIKPRNTPNNAAAFLLPDGKTLVQVGVLARCIQGGPVYGWRYFPNVSLYGDGRGGGHFGSGLSSIGGSIRKGELINNQAIAHALKVVIWGNRYLYYSKDRRGFRYPADRADAYAANDYKGKNPALVQGSLLAIPPDVNLKNLQLKTAPAKKIFSALQDYGAYVVDDAAWDAHYIEMESGVSEEVRKTYGFNMAGNKGDFFDDINKLFTQLQVVDNNSPNSIGGGGRPRKPLAPPITRE